MEPTYNTRPEKKDRKPIYILIGFLALFGIFAYVLAKRGH